VLFSKYDVTVCCMKSLQVDVSSHRRVVDETVIKLQSSLIDTPALSHLMSSSRNRYENLLAMTQVNILYVMTGMLQFIIRNNS